MRIKIKKTRDNVSLPKYQTSGAAGFDLHAAIDEVVTIEPNGIGAFPTGIAVEIPAGYELQIRPRSGLAYKHHVTMLNGIGTIDSDFRGEMQVLLINYGNQDFIVTPNMRIAQGIVARVEHVEWQEVDNLSETDRGEGGLGSTGH
ncbi:dUTP diphosphatase [Candidatus Saccharibacteria bacterium]|nr:dUTP diphosphatase [Candidatus Saccharibacteria bacterium]MCL1962882.1 dUTP diphosphatase [Candidatus Saccharibacteria bacterium]